MYTISVLLPASYLIGLVFTLKTHSHIYDIHISDGQAGHVHGQYAQVAGGTAHPAGEATTDHPLAANMSINASTVATSRGVSGVCSGFMFGFFLRVNWHDGLRH